MNFSTANAVEQVVWEMRQADYPRATNRALIDRLFNGFPPWTAEEQESAQINTNVNFLDGPKLAADARRSYYNAFLKPSIFFSMVLDHGPQRMRNTWGGIVTKEINRVMKDSLTYFEVIRCQMASTVLHGVGPVHWSDKERWKPRSLDVADLLVPSNTLLSLENLNHFAIFRQYTAAQMADMIERKNIDPAWNVTLARKAVEWAAKQAAGQRSAWDTLMPEKIIDQVKQDGVYYSSDVVPTIDCWDFYYYYSEAKKHGWRRCMILDTPPKDQIPDSGKKRISYDALGEKGSSWLYNGKKRTYADDSNQILHFQFGDLSPRAPFKYHSVRSLGWLIYAVCNLQNRLRCKVNDATFENLLNYFRVNNAEDGERLTKIDLHNYGVVPDGVDFVPQTDRWQINHNLVLATMADNRTQMNEAAAQFREGRDVGGQKEKTATEIMAEVNAANALVGTMLLLAYNYQKAQYVEIVRRFFRANSPDPEVRQFRLRVLKQGVPAELLNPVYWQVNPEQVLGSGNKVLQIAMAEKLMAVRPLLDPDSQRDLLRMYVQANSDDPNLATRWVPPRPILVTESTHDAELMVGPIMQGVQVRPRAGQDPAQIAIALTMAMGQILQRIGTTTRVGTPAEMAGLVNMGVTIQRYLAQAAQDPANKEMVGQVQAQLTEMMKMVGEMGKAMQAQQPQGNGQQIDPKVQKEMAVNQVKVDGMRQQAATKAEIQQRAADQRFQQREEQHAAKLRQNEEDHIAGLRKKLREGDLDAALAMREAETNAQTQQTQAATEGPQE